MTLAEMFCSEMVYRQILGRAVKAISSLDVRSPWQSPMVCDTYFHFFIGVRNSRCNRASYHKGPSINNVSWEGKGEANYSKIPQFKHTQIHQHENTKRWHTWNWWHCNLIISHSTMSSKLLWNLIFKFLHLSNFPGIFF